MALKIPGSMTVCFQCKDKDGNIGTFLRDENGIQFGETYIDAYHLFKGHEYKFCLAHEIPVN